MIFFVEKSHVYNILLFRKYTMNSMTEIEENMWELFFAPDLTYRELKFSKKRGCVKIKYFIFWTLNFLSNKIALKWKNLGTTTIVYRMYLGNLKFCWEINVIKFISPHSTRGWAIKFPILFGSNALKWVIGTIIFSNSKIHTYNRVQKKMEELIHNSTHNRKLVLSSSLAVSIKYRVGQ